MSIVKEFLAGGAAVAALAAAAPASAQYAYPYGYNYGQGYGTPYGYGHVTQIAAQQCTAAVQNRLVTRTGLSGLIGALMGATATSPRVLSITDIDTRRSSVRVRGLASSGRYAQSPYGYGYYGALGAGYAADLRFRCDVDYRGFVRDVDIRRR